MIVKSSAPADTVAMASVLPDVITHVWCDQVFNEIMDTFCPRYESNSASLSELARVQLLRGIGVAIVKHGAAAAAASFLPCLLAAKRNVEFLVGR